ncbi:L-threonine ammonia-lyase-like isoform X1 [Lepisosteus oculatus]|uniref:L-threonine ammonia-lyase-like isoform X1 n=1 Tax=Lepisosteus oculatus TaxID=7918 RepID=UPI00371076C8
MNFAAQFLYSRYKNSATPREARGSDGEENDPFWQRSATPHFHPSDQPAVKRQSLAQATVTHPVAPPPPPLQSHGDPAASPAQRESSSIIPKPLLLPFQDLVGLLLRLALSLIFLLFFSEGQPGTGNQKDTSHREGRSHREGPIRNGHVPPRPTAIHPERLKDFGEEEYLNGDVKTLEMKIVGRPEPLLGDPAIPPTQKVRQPSQETPAEFIRFEDISAAALKIQSGVQKTPCTYSRLSKQCGIEIFLKKEYLQYTGTVKERGVLCLLSSLRQEQQKKGVIVASDSNFAMAVAHQACELHIPVFIIMAADSSPTRLRMCREYGAMVISYGSTPQDSQSHARRLAQENGYLYLEEVDNAMYLAGLGTVGLEMFEQVPKLDAVVVPAGGHSRLLAGTAAALKHLNRRISVIGVEPEDFPLLQKSLKIDHPVKEQPIAPNRKLYGDLVGPPFGKEAFQLVKKLVDKVVTVSEQDALLSMLRFQEYERATVDTEGAIGLAAILAGKLPELKGKRVAVLVSSANMELDLMRQCVDRALALDSRVNKFTVQLGRGPGDLAKLLDLLAREDVSLLDIRHEAQIGATDLFHGQVSCVVETRDKSQTAQLRSNLSERYATLRWQDR